MKLVGLMLLLGLAAGGCNQPRQALPDVLPGRVSPGYEMIFGRLQRIPARDPQEKPTWVIRYGLTSSDAYNGELALMPPEALAGYSGGEPVQVRGQIDPTFKSPNYAGTFYHVREIYIWNGSENRK